MESLYSFNTSASETLFQPANISATTEYRNYMINASDDDPSHNYSFTEDDIKMEFQLMLRQYLYELYKKRQSEQLYEVPWTLVILLSLLYGSVSMTSLLGNGLVIWVVMVSRKMRTVTNLYIGNLALADIIIGLFSIPFQFQAALLQRWHLPNFMCAFCPFFQVLSVNLSVFTLSAIAMDRYRAVLHPLSTRPSRKLAVCCIALIWMFALLLAVPTFLDYKVVASRKLFNPEHPYCRNVGLSPSFRLYYHMSLVGTQYFIPLLIISVAYIRITIRLWGRTMPGNKEEGRDAIMLRNKKRAIKMLILVVLMFGVCWFPLQTYNLVQQIYPFINSYQYINVVWFVIHWLAMSNSCVNPFIYAIYNEKFQEEFSCRLGCFKRCFGVFARKKNCPNSLSVSLTERPVRANGSFRGGAHSNILLQNSTSLSKSPLIFKRSECQSLNNSLYSFTSRSNRSLAKNPEYSKPIIMVDNEVNPTHVDMSLHDQRDEVVECAPKDCKVIVEDCKGVIGLKPVTAVVQKSDTTML